MRFFKKLGKEEDGQALALVALMLVVLLGFAALAIDVGAMMNSKSRLQNAADAAALAGVMALPNVTDVNNRAYEYVNKNMNGSNTNMTVNVDFVKKQVQVTITENVKHYFAQIITQKSSSPVSATASAVKYVVWNGFSLPFINRDQDYSKVSFGSQMTLWNNLNTADQTGTFEVIEKTDIDQTTGFVSVGWNDGVTVAQGGNRYYFKDFIEPMLIDSNNPTVIPLKYVPPPYYTISLRDTVIQSGYVKVIEKTTGQIVLKALDNVLQGDTIEPSQLVLLEFSDASYAWQSNIEGKNDKSNGGIGNVVIKGTLCKVWDIGNGEIPTLDRDLGLIKSKLIK